MMQAQADWLLRSSQLKSTGSQVKIHLSGGRIEGIRYLRSRVENRRYQGRPCLCVGIRVYGLLCYVTRYLSGSVET